jgi:hypothetical protein
MTKSIERRVKKLENLLNVNRGKRRIAMVLYDPNICPQSDLPRINADVILCLPDNGHRIPKDQPMPPEG